MWLKSLHSSNQEFQFVVRPPEEKRQKSCEDGTTNERYQLFKENVPGFQTKVFMSRLYGQRNWLVLKWESTISSGKLWKNGVRVHAGYSDDKRRVYDHRNASNCTEKSWILSRESILWGKLSVQLFSLRVLSSNITVRAISKLLRLENGSLIQVTCR